MTYIKRKRKRITGRTVESKTIILSIVRMMEDKTERVTVDMASAGYSESYRRTALHLAIRKAIAMYGEKHRTMPVNCHATYEIDRNCFDIRVHDGSSASTLWEVKCDHNRLDWELGL